MAAPDVTYDKSLAQMSPAVLSAIRVYLLQAIVNGETVMTSAQDLITAAKCYIACIPEGILGAIEVYLLTQIANNGGGGGGVGTGGIICGELNPPVAAPTNACSLYYNSTTGGLWAWSSGGAAWIPFLQ